MKIVGLGAYFLLCSAIVPNSIAVREFPQYSHTIDTVDANSSLRRVKSILPMIPGAKLPEVPKSFDSYEMRMQLDGKQTLPLPNELAATSLQQNFTKGESAWEKSVENSVVNRREPIKGWLVHPKKDAWFGSRWMRSRLSRL